MDNRNLTERQRHFVNGVARGLSQTEAAKNAGYQVPAVAGCRLIHRPRIEAAVFAERQALIQGDLAGMALENLRWVLEDPGLRESNPDLVFRASKWVLELAGHRAEAGAENGSEDKPLCERTLADIQGSIERTEELRRSLDAVIAGMKRAEPMEAEQVDTAP